MRMIAAGRPCWIRKRERRHNASFCFLLHLVTSRIYPNFNYGDNAVDEFSIPGVPRDYYVALTNDLGVVEYSALRGKIRKLVEIYQQYIQSVIERGGKPHTASLDVSDIIKEFFSKEPEEARLAFFEVYTQELEAATSASIDDTNKINVEIAQKESSNFMAAQWILALIIFLVAMVLILK